MADLTDELHNRFGLDHFRPGQLEAIQELLGGRDVLCVMPTGAGKSLCYQLPAAVAGGLTIVVSPLISLMEDQVQQLHDEGINATLLNSSLTPAMQRRTMAELEEGFEGLLYVAPERFFASHFQNVLSKLKVRFLAVDEAHCISQWGHDFRREYSQLGAVRERLGNPPTIALTATATEDVRLDIIQGLNLHEPAIFVTGFDRVNLSYASHRISKNSEKYTELIRLVRGCEGSAIVYCSTRKNVDEVTPILAGQLRNREVVPYHAGLDQSTRSANQERFMQSPNAVAVATNAFGMGINKPDVRLVAHFNLPGTLEAYYQEAGRAGRDGLPAQCILLFSYQDRVLQEFFINKIGEEHDDVDPDSIKEMKARATEKLELMLRYAQTHHCRRQAIVDYFGDETTVDNCNCDVCSIARDGGTVMLPAVELSPETTLLVRKLLSGIARLNGKFGVGMIADVLGGVENERTRGWQLDQLSVFGLMKTTPLKRIMVMLHRMLESGLARQRNVGERGKPRYVIELTLAGVGVMKQTQPPPPTLADLLETPKSTKTKSTRVADADTQAVPLDEAASDRFERLRAARGELARERRLPAYCICHDSTLRLIAQQAPTDLAELEEIKGLGPYKIKMYGKKLLDALSDGQPV